MARDFLKTTKKQLAIDNPPQLWGYYVYCTYSNAEQYAADITVPDDTPSVPFSDTTSLTSISAFDNYVINRFEAYLTSYLKIQEPFLEGQEMLDTMRLDRIRLGPGASISEARKHFKTQVIPKDDEEKQYMMRYQLFVVIDDEALASIINGPEPVTGVDGPEDCRRVTREQGKMKTFVNVGDVSYDETCGGIITASRVRGPVEKGSPNCITYYGWSKVCPRSLLTFTDDVHMTGMRDLFKSPDSIYDEY